MRIKSIELQKVKSFDNFISIPFDEKISLFALSGKNGAGKSTILKAAWLVQKAHFCRLMNNPNEHEKFHAEASRFLNGPDSFIKIVIANDAEVASIRLAKKLGEVDVVYENPDLIHKYWSLSEPTNLILFVDASKGFSEDTLKFDEINIAKNNKHDLALEAILRPEALFSGIYRQLVKDHVHGRLIPSKPDRLLYFRVAANMFTTLIPTVELKNFSGNHKPGEFVLLGKANIDKRKPLYDVREFSSGEKALLSTLAFLCISKSVSALIIDEPENHFHESLLLEFISILNNLCDQGGVLKWVTNKSALDPTLFKSEWIEKEYKDHNLSQIIISTHSKSLIYKVFSMGQNFIVADNVTPIAYEDAEKELRKLGLSSIYNKIILVEGVGDHEALEYAVEGKNIGIKALNGSLGVAETFKRIAELKEYIQDSEFAFLVDSDNKPSDYFEKIREIDEEFYDKSFVKLARHEFENYLLDPKVISEVSEKYMSIAGIVSEKLSLNEVEEKIVEFARESLPQVYKKELSLSFQQAISTHFSNLIWGNKIFDWTELPKIKAQISSDVLSVDHMNLLQVNLEKSASDMFDAYGVALNQTLIDRCDGKQVLGRVSSYYAKISGVDNKIFKKALYKHAFTSKDSQVHFLVKKILKCFT